MNQNPKEARSRMPGASGDGTYAPNFGYGMGRSAAYKEWIKNPLACACGDIIVDAYHAIVDLGSQLNIDQFLERFQIHLSGKREDQNDFFGSHEYDRYITPLELFLLRYVYNTPFISDETKKSIPEELKKAAGENLTTEVRKCLNDLKEFSNNMLTRRPGSNAKKKWGWPRLSFWHWL